MLAISIAPVFAVSILSIITNPAKADDPILTNQKYAADITAGGSHTCGLFNDGNLAYCWGLNSDGQFGNSLSNDIPANNIPTATTASGVLNGLKPKSISAGFAHTCVVAGAATSSNDSVYCWGKGDNGQLGDGLSTTSNVPVAVASTAGASKVSAGFAHTCGIIAGAAYCWGDNDEGQLGNGTSGTCSNSTITDKSACTTSGATWTSANQPAPVAVDTSGVLAGKTVTDISAGVSHSCAVASGQVYCWGAGGSGQLGNNTLDSSTTPVLVANSTGATAVAVGFFYSCAIINGTVQCWGDNTSGQIGNNTTVLVDEPTATTGSALTGKTVKNISAGYAHVCVVAGNSSDSNADVAYCWGENMSGQLGINTNINTLIPTAVTPPASATGLVAKKTAAGFAHTCILYGNTANNASNIGYCTGDNSNGQVGDGTLTSAKTPQPIDTTNIPDATPFITAVVDNPVLNMNVVPTSAGNTTSASNELTVTTNNATGYIVQISTDTTNNTLNNPNAALNATSAPINGALPLPTNTWGFALPNNTVGIVMNNFNSSYTSPGTANFASVPTATSASTVVNNSTATTASGMKADFYFATKVDTQVQAGFYTQNILYTVVANI